MTARGDWLYLDPKVKSCWLIKGMLGLSLFLFLSVIFPSLLAYFYGGSINIYTIIFFLSVFFVLLTIMVAWILLFYERYLFSIAEDAILINRGILWKRSVTIPYERIQHVSVNRGPIEILLGIYIVNVFTAGTSSFGGSIGPPGMFGQFAAEGYIPGIADGEGLKETLMRRVKATKSGSGLGDETRTQAPAQAKPSKALPVLKVEESEMLLELRKIRKLLEKK